MLRIILKCLGEKAPLFWSSEFLKNIAEMNITKYQQSFDDRLKQALVNAVLPVIPGKVYFVLYIKIEFLLFLSTFAIIRISVVSYIYISMVFP